MELALQQAGGTVQVADAVFGARFNEALVHQVVTSYLAGARSGTRAQKTRAEVSGGNSKPWKQKGSGRARVGSSRNPIWRGGGVTFAAKPTDYSQKVNKKMYRGAMRAILSELARLDRLQVVDSFGVDAATTKELAQKLNALREYVQGCVLRSLHESEAFLCLSFVGGTALRGGVGRIWGTVCGALILELIGNIMVLSDLVSEYLIGAVQGAIIIVAMLVQRALSRGR